MAGAGGKPGVPARRAQPPYQPLYLYFLGCPGWWIRIELTVKLVEVPTSE